MTADDADANREVARTALEQVCSRGDMTLAPRCYAEDFADQVAEGDRVASRFVVMGSNRGRTLKLWGITISRLRDGRIVEDHSAFDSLELLSSSESGARCSRRHGCCARCVRGIRAERGSEPGASGVWPL
jgi:hypothetical protein